MGSCSRHSRIHGRTSTRWPRYRTCGLGDRYRSHACRTSNISGSHSHRERVRVAPCLWSPGCSGSVRPTRTASGSESQRRHNRDRKSSDISLDHRPQLATNNAQLCDFRHHVLIILLLSSRPISGFGLEWRHSAFNVRAAGISQHFRRSGLRTDFRSFLSPNHHGSRVCPNGDSTAPHPRQQWCSGHNRRVRVRALYCWSPDHHWGHAR